MLVDDLRVSKHVRDLADWAKSRSDIDLVALIVHPAPQSTKQGFAKFKALAERQGMYTAISRVAFAALVRIERKILLRSPHHREHLCLHHIGDRTDRHILTQPIVSKSGFVYRFSDEDLAKITALKLDALIRCGNGILKGDILSAAKHGVISMHHGDNRVNRGGPAAFWEVFHGQPQTGFIIQRLTEELDGGEVLFRGSVSTALFYTINQFNLYERGNTYLERTIQRLAARNIDPEAPHIYDGRMYRTPLLHESATYVLRTANRVAGKALKRAMRQECNWGVAYTFQPWHSAVLWRGKTLFRPKGSFIADPFAIRVNGSHFVFVEEYGYSTRKGVIAAYKLDSAGAERIGIVLEEPWHLSFPFLFQHAGNIYMVPESMADRSIKLYRAEQFPSQWSLAKVIMADTVAADTLIFEHGRKWWMLTTIRGQGGAANDAELHAFHSDDPLGKWTPHLLNPVVMDASKGRNGGLLRDDAGQLYRVAQRHAFTAYGVGVALYRIDDLTSDTYQETFLQNVEPNFFHGISGSHHLHADGDLTVFDYSRRERPSLGAPIQSRRPRPSFPC